MAKRPFDPNELLLDNGQTVDTTNLRGAGLATVGRTQSRMRAGANRQRFAPLMLGNPGMGDYFGLLQAKENAANASGRHFNVNFDEWGNDAFKPGTTWDEEQTPLDMPESLQALGRYNRNGFSRGMLGEAAALTKRKR